MNLLLDTHAFLWYYSGSQELSVSARKAISISDSFYLSKASLWEISIKYSLGRMDLGCDLSYFFSDVQALGFTILPIEVTHILKSSALPYHHRDPFDRLIIAQALTEDLVLISKDSYAESYIKSEGLRFALVTLIPTTHTQP